MANSSLETEVEQAAKAWMDAAARLDEESLSRVLAAEFTMLNSAARTRLRLSSSSRAAASIHAFAACSTSVSSDEFAIGSSQRTVRTVANAPSLLGIGRQEPLTRSR